MIDIIENAYQTIAGDFKPDITFILDINPEIGLKRSLARSGNVEVRFEGMDLKFHQNLRYAFLKIAAENPTRCKVIDANQSIEQVHQSIIEAFQEKVRC